jgi:hypothetical protein
MTFLNDKLSFSDMLLTMHKSLNYSLLASRVSILISSLSLGVSCTLLSYISQSASPSQEIPQTPRTPQIREDSSVISDFLSRCLSKSSTYCINQYKDIEEQTECLLLAKDMCSEVEQERQGTSVYPSGTVQI